MLAPAAWRSWWLPAAGRIPAMRIARSNEVAGYPPAVRRRPQTSLHCMAGRLGAALVRRHVARAQLVHATRASLGSTHAQTRSRENYVRQVPRFVESGSGQPMGCNSSPAANGRHVRSLCRRSETLFDWPHREPSDGLGRRSHLPALSVSASRARTASSESGAPDRETAGRLAPLALRSSPACLRPRDLRADGSLSRSWETVPKRMQQAAPRNRKPPLAGQRGPGEQSVRDA